MRIIATEGATDCYLWGDKSIEFHCQNCGRVTHWAAVEQPANRMGVNARLMAQHACADSTGPTRGKISVLYS